MTIRVRLTLWNTALVGVVLVTFCALFYWVLTASLIAEVDRTLDRFTQETHRALGHSSDASPLQHSTAVSLESLPVNDFASPGVYVQVLDDQGSLVAVSSNLQGAQLPVDADVVRQSLGGQSVTANLSTSSGDRVRVLTTPVIVQGRTVGLVQVGQSLHTLDDTAARVRILLVAGLFIAINLAALIGYALAGRALAPVTQMAATAQQIAGAQDLAQRIALRGDRDELDVLASALNAMLRRLQTAFLSQQQFVADSSHELRTPLTIIRGNLDLLARATTAEERRQSLDAIQRETSRMAAIVDDLLLLAQLEAPPPARPRIVDLDAVLTDAYRTLLPLDTGRTLSLGTVDALQVMGDADQLKRLVLNLARNALTYTPPAGRVEISCTASGAGQAIITVSDTGPGIPPTDLPHIFERFYRVEKAHARESGGTGLGLAIVKAIAEAHGGTVQVRSQLGKGSVFAVTLPLARA